MPVGRRHYGRVTISSLNGNKCILNVTARATPFTKRYAYAGQALQDRLLSRSDLKERWACSLETLKRRAKDGLLCPLKLGRKVKYRLSEIVEEECEAESTL